MSRFCGPRSSQCPGFGCVTASGASRPGRTSSVVAPPGCIALLVLLARAGDPERIRWNVPGYHRSSPDPCSVADRHRCAEAIVDRGPDVVADGRPLLRLTRLVREVRRDRAGADVRVRADVRVTDIREVRNLGPVTDARILHLHEGACFGGVAENRSGAKVTERSDVRVASDLRV